MLVPNDEPKAYYFSLSSSQNRRILKSIFSVLVLLTKEKKYRKVFPHKKKVTETTTNIKYWKESSNFM